MAWVPGVSVAIAAEGVKLNEIMFDPADDDARGQWIELHNSGEEAVDLSDWTIANRTGRSIVALPPWRLPPGAFLVVYFGGGENDRDFEDRSGSFVVARPAEPLQADHDDIGLYSGQPDAERIVDFVAYQFDGKRETSEAYMHALAAGIWTPGSVFDDAIFVEPENSIGRSGHGEDSDKPMDWWGRGGVDSLRPTPGASNTHPLGYELCGLTQSLALAAQLLGAPSAEMVAMFNRVIKQIREKHTDLLARGDGGLGTGEPQQQANGDIVVGNIRFVFKPKLEHNGANAGGLTHPPKTRGGQITIELSESALDAEWKMKDAVLHEIDHAAQFQSAQSGYWRDNDSAQSNGTRTRALKVHECNCYLSNLRLLCRFKVIGEFKEHSHDIDARIRFKVGKMEWYLNRAFESLAQFARNTASWDLFGESLANHLLAQRDMFLKAKIIGLRLPNDAEIEKGRPGTLTASERKAIFRQANRWNSISDENNRLTRADVLRLINSDINDLIKDLGKPPAPRVAQNPRNNPVAPKPPVQETAEARAERLRVAMIRQRAKDLERRRQIAKNARHHARTELASAKVTKEIAESTFKNEKDERQQKLKKKYLKHYNDAKKRFDDAHAAVVAIEKEQSKFKKKNKKELASARTSKSRRTHISGPHKAFNTDVGAQVYASLEHVTMSGDPSNLQAFHNRLTGYRDLFVENSAEAKTCNGWPTSATSLPSRSTSWTTI
ncbi:MAG: lamin tail domain-containing protein [Pirellulaceae bacterium]|nr:lamin tail domain-containing protein [Pirellulaceae bacterium]